MKENEAVDNERLVVIAYLIMLITSKIASYIDNVNEVKSKTAIQKYYFEKVQSMTMEKQV